MLRIFYPLSHRWQVRWQVYCISLCIIVVDISLPLVLLFCAIELSIFFFKKCVLLSQVKQPVGYWGSVGIWLEGAFIAPLRIDLAFTKGSLPRQVCTYVVGRTYLPDYCLPGMTCETQVSKESAPLAALPTSSVDPPLVNGVDKGQFGLFLLFCFDFCLNRKKAWLTKEWQSYRKDLWFFFFDTSIVNRGKRFHGFFLNKDTHAQKLFFRKNGRPIIATFFRSTLDQRC